MSAYDDAAALDDASWTPPPRLSRRALLGALALAPALPWFAKASHADDEDDPPKSKWPSAVSGMPRARQQHTATPLGGGYVLVAGGLSQQPLDDVEILGPDGVVCAAAPLNVPRFGHAAVRLSGSRIVVLGGCGPDPLDSVESYDLDSDTWTLLRPLCLPRCLHAAVRLSEGKILLTGGFFQGLLAETELYAL